MKFFAIASLIALASATAVPQSVPVGQDVPIECMPGAGGFPLSVTIVDSTFCFTSAELGEGFPKATSATLLGTEVVTSCRAWEDAKCNGKNTVFTTENTPLAEGIAGNVGSWSCP